MQRRYQNWRKRGYHSHRPCWGAFLGSWNALHRYTRSFLFERAFRGFDLLSIDPRGEVQTKKLTKTTREIRRGAARGTDTVAC